MSFWNPDREIETGLRGNAETPIVYTPKAIDLLSIKDQRERLPVFKARDQLLFLMESKPVVIVVGATGSGKTTQIPQYLAETGWTANGMVVACTQPRRIACCSVAQRVAEEVGVQIGTTVGYSVRFDDCSDARLTRIKYLTDGMLFRETLLDPLLTKYSAIMVDEAHERSLYTDLLLGVLKRIMRKRPELRLIIASATLDTELFRSFFKDSVTMSVDGRMFPVDTLYVHSPCQDYIRSAIETVFQIHRNESQGDILVFVTGRNEAEEICEELSSDASLLAVPLYSGVSSEAQAKVFESPPRNTRKVVVATNVAEASLTIEGIVYVVDCGFVKQRVFNPRLGMDSLLVVPVSQASSQQRAGRAGRTRPGKCFRLYTEHSFDSMDTATIPEILRSNLSTAVLQLKALGIENIVRFDFLDPPAPESLAYALELLYSLKALDDYGRLTMPLGTTLAEIPLDPMLATILLNGHSFKCTEEILTIAAMLSVEPVFVSPANHRRDAEAAKRLFAVEEGDHITYVNAFDAFKSIPRTNASKWCHTHFLNFNALSRAVSVRSQLRKYLKRFGVTEMTSCGSDTVALRKCLVSGYFSHAAKLQPDGSYKTLRGNTVLHIHPNSCLFKRSPKWIVFHEVVQTTKAFMRDVTVIEREWLTEIPSISYYQSASYKKSD